MNLKGFKRIVCAAVAAIGLAAFGGQPSYQSEMTVGGYSGTTELTDFPVLVRISPERISGFGYDQLATATDFGFVDATGTQLPYEVDTWNPDGESLVWVKLPRLSGTATKFYFQWKHKTPVANTPSAVWSRYACVIHCGETLADSSPNNLSITANGASVTVATGKVGASRNKATRNSVGITVPNPLVGGKLSAPGKYSVSMWMKPNHAAETDVFYATCNAWAGVGLLLLLDNNAGGKVIFSIKASTWASYLPQWKQDTWFHCAFSYSPDTLHLFENGVLKSSKDNPSAVPDGQSPWTFGSYANRGSNDSFGGEMDELRIFDGAASDDWIAAEYGSVDNANYVTAAAAEEVAESVPFTVKGLPGQIGEAVPDYRVHTEYKVGDGIDCTVTETTVDATGTAKYCLLGWELRTVDAEAGTKTLVRSSAVNPAAGENATLCKYTHESEAELTWLWELRDQPGVANVAVESMSYSNFTVSADVTGIGYADGDEVTFVVKWGREPQNLIYEKALAPARAAGSFTATVEEQIVPSMTHYAQVTAKAKDGTTIYTGEVVSFTATPSKPGLWQAYFTNARLDWSKDVRALPIGTEWGKYLDTNRIRRRELGPIAAFASPVLAYPSAVWGDSITWSAGNNAQWAYVGFIYIEADVPYRFRAYVDDDIYIKIGNDVVLQDSTWNTADTSGTFQWTAAGWYPLEVRMSDYSGGMGAQSSDNTVNLGWSKDGGSTWQTFLDPGDGSFLITDYSDEGHSLFVTSSGANLGTPSPAYGEVRNIADGQSFECFAPADIESADTRAVCTGWKLYTRDAVSGEWVFASEDSTKKCVFVQPAGVDAKLEWQWTTEFLVRASAGAGGQVRQGDGDPSATVERWVAEGAVVAFTAVPEDGKTAVWTAGAPLDAIDGATLNLTVTGPAEAKVSFFAGEVLQWKGGAEGARASDGANWLGGVAPQGGERIVLAAGATDMLWDLAEAVPSGWLQLADYAGTVTFATTYPGGALPEIVIGGDVELLGGRWTHQANGETEAYRLSVRVNGDLTVGEGAAIDAVGKGLSAVGAESSHPSLLQPTGCGTATADSAGGGAVALTVDGKLTVAGAIDASGAPTTDRTTGAGGSVWIRAGAIEASGRIAAEGGSFIANGTHGGAGGRVAVALTGAGSDFSDVAAGVLSATAGRGYTGVASDASPCGTVYRKTKTEARGLLVVDNAVGSVMAVPTVFDPAQASELSQAALTIGSNAQVKISGKLSVGDLVFAETTAKLDLDGQVLKVKTVWHAYPEAQVVNAGEWIDGKKPGYANIKWVTPGLKILFY